MVEKDHNTAAVLGRSDLGINDAHLRTIDQDSAGPFFETAINGPLPEDLALIP